MRAVRRPIEIIDFAIDARERDSVRPTDIGDHDRSGTSGTECGQRDATAITRWHRIGDPGIGS